MLEIAIIICLALILFLILKNFPKTASEKEAGVFDQKAESQIPVNAIVAKVKKTPNFLQKVFSKKRKDNLDGIKAAIEKGQGGIIAPVEINQAKRAYKEEDSEIARILYEADLALMRNDLREAEELALKAILKDKKSARSYIVIGKVAFARGSFDDAKESFKTALKCDDESGEAYFGLGQIELRDENFSQALDNLQKAVNLDRGVAEWYAELGKAYMQVRQFAKAAKALKRAASLDIDNKEYKELASEAEDKQRAHSTVYRHK